MYYGECKVYNDGSHYIAIPRTSRPSRRRPKVQEEVITVIEKEKEGLVFNTEPSDTILEQENNSYKNEKTETEEQVKLTDKTPKIERRLTKKEYFNELYKEYIDLKKKERRNKLIYCLRPYFKKEEDCIAFVDTNLERKQRNLICRRVRMSRKANLADFNYFVTFTYDDLKHDECTFKKKLQSCFKMLCHRKDWKYMGVWERAPETKRLHFHGLFNIPKGTMPGELEEHKDYSFSEHKRIITYQNSFFNDRFGRSDFKEINTHKDLAQELSYLMKYIEKTDEKIVYSKNLYQYFISDILKDDVVCTIGQEDRKLLLFDDFMCLDEGCLIGNVSKEVISQMRKCNS